MNAFISIVTILAGSVLVWTGATADLGPNLSNPNQARGALILMGVILVIIGFAGIIKLLYGIRSRILAARKLGDNRELLKYLRLITRDGKRYRNSMFVERQTSSRHIVFMYPTRWSRIKTWLASPGFPMRRMAAVQISELQTSTSGGALTRHYSVPITAGYISVDVGPSIHREDGTIDVAVLERWMQIPREDLVPDDGFARDADLNVASQEELKYLRSLVIQFATMPRI